MLQKLHLCVVSHKTKRTIDRVFPDYNIALRELTIQAAVIKAKLLKEKEKEKIYRSSFLGISSRVFHSVMPEFAFSLFYKSNNNNNNNNNDSNNNDSNNNNISSSNIGQINEDRKNSLKMIENRSDSSTKSYPPSQANSK